MDHRPGPGVTQAPEGHVHRAPGWKILRQHPSLAATAFHVPDRVIQASRAVFAGPPDVLGVEKPFDLRPFPVAYVTGILHRSVLLADRFASLHGFVNSFSARLSPLDGIAQGFCQAFQDERRDFLDMGV